MRVSLASGWVRLLVVVLALTASRTNFPLPKRSSPPGGAAAAVTSSKRNSEDVIPSRRNLDGHRTESLEMTVLNWEPHPPALVPIAEEPPTGAFVPAIVDDSFRAECTMAALLREQQIPQRSPFPPPL